MKNTGQPSLIIPKKLTYFSDSVKLAYKYGRLYGLFPFTINYTPNGEVESNSIHVLDMFLFALLLIVCSTLALLGYSALTPTKDVRTTILLLGSRIILISVVFFSAISSIMDFFNRHRLINIVKHVQEFDNEVGFFRIFPFLLPCISCAHSQNDLLLFLLFYLQVSRVKSKGTE